MKVREAGPGGLLLFEPAVHRDARGSFLETWHAERYSVLPAFVQDNRSVSLRGVLRGLHYQHPKGQGKLVSVSWGEVFDVAVDVRRGSPTFGRWWGEVLSAENHRQLYVPEGFAHGFVTRSDVAVVSYKCTTLYSPEHEHTLSWNDPDLAIDWGVIEPVLSDKDRAGPRLADLTEEELPAYDPAKG